mgnify:FL=1
MNIQELKNKYILEREKLEELQEKTVERLVFIEGALHVLLEVDEKDTPNG